MRCILFLSREGDGMWFPSSRLPPSSPAAAAARGDALPARAGGQGIRGAQCAGCGRLAGLGRGWGGGWGLTLARMVLQGWQQAAGCVLAGDAVPVGAAHPALRRLTLVPAPHPPTPQCLTRSWDWCSSGRARWRRPASTRSLCRHARAAGWPARQLGRPSYERLCGVCPMHVLTLPHPPTRCPAGPGGGGAGAAHRPRTAHPWQHADEHHVARGCRVRTPGEGRRVRWKAE